MYLSDEAAAVAVAVLPNFNFTIRPMISVQAKNRSRGRLMVNSAPLRYLTAVPNGVPPRVRLRVQVVIHVENGEFEVADLL